MAQDQQAVHAGTSGTEQMSGILVYGPEFFANTALPTALDMVQRLPGFTLDIGNGDARGIAGNTGNVLIDGKPPASKTDGLGEILRRISASGVARIELIRGGAPGIDMQGRAVIANVVLKRTASTEKLINFQSYVYRDGYVGPDLTLQYTRRDGDRRDELSLEVLSDRTSYTSQGIRTRTDASGRLLQRHSLDLWDRDRTATLRTSIQRALGGGLLTVNARLDYFDYPTSQTVTLLEGSGSSGRAIDLTHQWKGELGANWNRPLGSKSELEVIALQRLGRTRYDSTTDAGGFVSTFGQRSRNGESVLRPILRYKPGKTLSLEGGGEIAYNFLDNRTDYAEQGIPVPLPDQSVFVSEVRGEVFGLARWQPSGRITVEAGMRAEISRIAADADSNRARTFFYPKPRLQLTWRPNKRDQLRLRVEQSVSQLDFSDFVAATEINLGTVRAGNGDLVPEQALTLEAVVEHRFWGKGALELSAKHEATRNVIDYIPLDGGFDAIGNIGTGTRNTLASTLTLPFDKLGIKDARFRGNASVVRSHVTDPLTGARRRYASEVPFTCSGSFSQDLFGGRFTYGVFASCGQPSTSLYRIREFRTTEVQPSLEIYTIWKPSKRLAIRLDLGNLNNAARIYDRDLYTGERNASPLLFRERRTQRRGQYVYVQFRRTL
ncbi:TonB-dependent receptor plug domain-containing protein [Sphingomonas elodea]|uniref:TonB-dependent receptor plug domain-containing protein n=1 Tax=Sphingomonas elodea TaxID=179878 RepID=UPI001ED93FB7|nr:TonB-dependent receptor [Sphingomonas elodea]